MPPNERDVGQLRVVKVNPARTRRSTAEDDAYASYMLRVAWLRGAAWQLFDFEEELRDDPLLDRFGPGDLGMLAAAPLDHAGALQMLSDYPSTDDLHGDFPPCERVS